MSGIFERIARRHPERSQEPDAASPEGASATPDVTEPATTGEATSGAPAGDAPTERIDITHPSSSGGQATASQPAATPPEHPTAGASPEGVARPAVTPEQPTVVVDAPRRPGFRARGRMRRRLRYLRKLRDLQVRDLGGLVFDLRRFARKRDDLVTQKIDQIRACDDELRALELALDERRDLRDVREPGIGGTCPRCFAIFGSADRFCATCGAALGGAVQGPAQVPLAAPSSPAATAPAASPPAGPPAAVPPPAPAAPPTAAPPEAAGGGRDGV